MHICFCFRILHFCICVMRCACVRVAWSCVVFACCLIVRCDFFICFLFSAIFLSLHSAFCISVFYYLLLFLHSAFLHSRVCVRVAWSCVVFAYCLIMRCDFLYMFSVSCYFLSLHSAFCISVFYYLCLFLHSAFLHSASCIFAFMLYVVRARHFYVCCACVFLGVVGALCFLLIILFSLFSTICFCSCIQYLHFVFLYFCIFVFCIVVFIATLVVCCECAERCCVRLCLCVHFIFWFYCTYLFLFSAMHICFGFRILDFCICAMRCVCVRVAWSCVVFACCERVVIFFIYFLFSAIFCSLHSAFWSFRKILLC